MTPGPRGGLLLLAAVALGVALFSRHWWVAETTDERFRGSSHIGLIEGSSCFQSRSSGSFLTMFNDEDGWDAEQCASETLRVVDTMPRRLRLLVWAGRLAFALGLVAMATSAALGVLLLARRGAARGLAATGLISAGLAMVAVAGYLGLRPRPPGGGPEYTVGWAAIAACVGLAAACAGHVLALLRPVPAASRVAAAVPPATVASAAISPSAALATAAPDGRPTPACPSCTRPMPWSPPFQRHFCARCRIYL